MKKIGFDIDPAALPEGRFKSFLRRCDELDYVNRVPGVIVNGLPIYFDFHFRRIGITLSGGADSSLLLYILCRIIKEFKLKTKIFPICVVRNWEAGDHGAESKRGVIHYLNRRFPGIIQEATWSFIPAALDRTPASALILEEQERPHLFKPETSHIDVYFFAMLSIWSARKDSLQAVYGGVTSNPPLTTSRKLIPLGREEVHHPVSNFGFQAPVTFNGTSYEHREPFEFIDKAWVLAQYKNFQIEDLLEITQSCERQRPACGDCFHCDEREWGARHLHPFLDPEPQSPPVWQRFLSFTSLF